MITHPHPSWAQRRTITAGLSWLQFSGINNAFNFSTSFLKQNGLTDDQCALVAVLMNVANFIVTIASVLLMDKVNRTCSVTLSAALRLHPGLLGARPVLTSRLNS